MKSQPPKTFTKGQDQTPVVPIFWRFHIKYKRCDPNFPDFLDIETSVATHVDYRYAEDVLGWWEITTVISCLVFFLLFLFCDWIQCCVQAPYRLYLLFWTNRPVTDCIIAFLDPAGRRISVTPWRVSIFCENLATTLFFLGCLVSITKQFDDTVPVFLGLKQPGEFQFTSLAEELSHLKGGYQVLTWLQLMFSSGLLHGPALVLFIVRMFEWFTIIKFGGFIVLLLQLAFYELVEFIAVFFVGTFLYSVFMRIRFGMLFTTFSTVPRAFSFLLRYNLNIGTIHADVENGLQTESEFKAAACYTWLAIYSFCFAIMLINVLITIVVNAYNATRNATVRKQLEGRSSRKIEQAVHWFRRNVSKCEVAHPEMEDHCSDGFSDNV